ncbi:MULTISPECIES: TetR/AcrR family transcriptional regulator [Nocardiaceae]|uniref:TetR/AcrR family transcriptional regulator n=1 Tax=Nocardiaceae TaxID=85025 RepID=UPI000710EF13|nr:MULTISPECIES: TetR/AcrR family transcriptional regulator [Rhodococcus]MDP9637879.1 AcrR family transcriptional regulator [Rhodococcus cercidiphylli]KQU29842.1 transcriptional regulator [Rhodococcus sp. Leaf233]MDJ0412234.1 TetR/AcrR family transcriptional regulator [Rhodococcus fascians]MDQ0280906.1 AcrR family transcriptional regulator [Rhodococcus fascians]OZC95750.1 TetR/AcrR family transcriptional regulator [Rhodococcus sp. 06-221-2]
MATTGRAHQAEQTRIELENAARAVFARSGYLNTKIVDITREAGRAAGSFYNHYSGKDGLLLALAEQIGEDADVIVAAQDPSARDHPTMRPHLEVFWQLLTRHRVVIDALRDAALVSPEFAERMQRFTQVQFEPWVERLSAFEKAGVELPAPPATTAMLIGGAAENFARLWQGSPEGGLDALVAFVDRGVFGQTAQLDR